MQFIKPRVEIITEPDLYKRIEIGARNCYKSEEKITQDSAVKMVKALIKRGHESPLEHSSISIECSNEETASYLRSLLDVFSFAKRIPHFIRITPPEGEHFVAFSGNVRAWRTLCLVYPEDFLLCSALLRNWPDLFSDVLKRADDNSFDGMFRVYANQGHGDEDTIVTARFVCDRGVSHELVRHRLLSVSQESTRYVNYKDGLTLIEPWWWPQQETVDTQFVRASCQAAEDAYVSLINSGSSPQKARAVLPNMLKTEVVATGTVEYWKKYVLPLRLSKAAHPDIVRLMELFCEQMNWNPDDFRK